MSQKYRRFYPQIYTFENLARAARLARRGKRGRAEVCEFEYDLEHHLLEIRRKLRDETYTFAPYRCFTIREPKERLIHAAPFADRVVHHALCNLIGPVLERAMIADSYACRTGKGAHLARDRAQHFLRGSPWVLKMDLRKYFFTIDHELLMNQIARKITDGQVLCLLRKLLATYTSGNDYYLPFESDTECDRLRPRGLPIGNLTSQILANYYLTPFDRFVKEELKCRRYLRYMDDCLIFSATKSDLAAVKKQATEYLADLRLKVHTQKSQIFPSSDGVNFLGFHLYPFYRRIRRANLIRFKNAWLIRQRQYRNSEIDFKKLLLSLNGWLGFGSHPDTNRLINSILQQYRFTQPEAGSVGFTFYLPLG